MERVVKIITETLFFTSIGIGVMMCDLDQHSGNAPAGFVHLAASYFALSDLLEQLDLAAVPQDEHDYRLAVASVRVPWISSPSVGGAWPRAFNLQRPDRGYQTPDATRR